MMSINESGKFKLNGYFIAKYKGRCIEIKTIYGSTLRCIINGLVEDNEFVVNDVYINEKKFLPVLVLSETIVDSFVPLEGENEVKPFYYTKDDLGVAAFVEAFKDSIIKIECLDGNVLVGLMGNVTYGKGQEVTFKEFELNGKLFPVLTVHKSKFTAYLFIDKVYGTPQLLATVEELKD